MDFELNPIEIRVLGCLIEKEIATPDYYPLTLSALASACNQKSNRCPVLTIDQASIESALFELRIEHQLAAETKLSGSRVPKIRHRMDLHWEFTPAQMAILCELFVRGPQTPGDLRAHANRLYPLTDSNEVEQILQELVEYADGPYVVQLPREPGKRERRWAHLFSGEPEIDMEPDPIVEVIAEAAESKNARIQALEEEVAALRQELDELKISVAEFRTAFE